MPDVPAKTQILIQEMIRRTDEETHAILKGVEAGKAKTVRQLHELIVPPMPDSTSPERLSESFRALADQWRRETGMQSSITKKVKHAAYQKIITMGEVAVPLILKELCERQEQWFEALKLITGENPVPPESRKDMTNAVRAWLEWGKKRGYQ